MKYLQVSPAFNKLAIIHGEKIGFGLVAAIVLVCLALSDWAAYQRTPRELSEHAVRAEHRLLSGNWPANEQNAHPLRNFDSRVTELLRPLERDRFAYSVPLIMPLTRMDEPLREPRLVTVEDLLASPGRSILALRPEDPPDRDGGDLFAELANEPGRRASRRRDGYGLASAREAADGAGAGRHAPRAMAAERAGGNSRRKTGTAAARIVEGRRFDEVQTADIQPWTRAKGMRYALVTGVVDLQQQLENFRGALNLDQRLQARDELEYLDFIIERQQAGRGASPWRGDAWVRLDIQVALNTLQDVAAFDPEIVDSGITNVVFTMPLPALAYGFWDDGERASHPRVKGFKLSREEMQRELELNRLLIEQVLGAGEAPSQTASRKGFAVVQYDVNTLQRDAWDGNLKNLSPEQILSALQERLHGTGGDGRMPPAGPGAATSGRGARAAHHGQSGRMWNPRLSAAGRLLLFRYIDFSVEPGDTYRYRVKLVLRNPSYGRGIEEVADPTVAQGATRETDWSKPSAPVSIKADYEFFLAGVHSRGWDKGRAMIEMYQWYSETGTQIRAMLEGVAPGQFIGGKARTELLNVAIPSLRDEEVTFSSPEALVDTRAALQVMREEHPDLNESLIDHHNRERRGGRRARPLKMEVGVDFATIANRFGLLRKIDTLSSRPAKARALAGYQREQDEFQDLDAATEDAEALRGLLGIGARGG